MRSFTTRKEDPLAPRVSSLLAVALTLAACGGSGSSGESSAAAGASRDYVIVSLQDPPAASAAESRPARGAKLNLRSPKARAYLARLASGRAQFKQFLAGAAPGAEVVREYGVVLNGVAVKLNGARAAALLAGPGVRVVAESEVVRPSMNVSVWPTNTYPDGVIGALGVWGGPAGAPSAGAGVKVGVIDSGIDDSHPFFACKGTIPHKLYAAGAAFDPTNVFVSTHGTHVAGTIAGCVSDLATLDPDGPVTGTVDGGTGKISGVAPGAALFDYDVFPGFGGGYVAFGGSAFSHDIAAALEDAVVDGMDVVNMSLGGTVQGPNDLLAEAVDAAADAGVVVAVAAGNSGPGDSTVESPGSAPKALTAGASTNPHFAGIAITAGATTLAAAYGDFAHFGDVTLPFSKTTPANGCTAITSPVAGQVAVIARGTCTFQAKVSNAQAAGAAGVVVTNNVAGDPSAMGLDGTQPVPTIPAAMISLAEGAALPASGTFVIAGTTVRELVTPNADIIAGFSSRGPTPFTLLVKPDVTAPGVNVYSSVWDEAAFATKDLAFFQGTSMATPHVAGSAALLRWAHPGWSPADVKSALANNAKRPVYDSATGTVDAGQRARGGGRISLPAATSTPVTIDPVSASFGLVNGNATAAGAVTLTLHDVSGAGSTCTATAGAPVSASPASVAIPADGTATVTLALDLGKAAQAPSGDYSGDVVVECSGRALLVPWFVRVDRNGKP